MTTSQPRLRSSLRRFLAISLTSLRLALPTDAAEDSAKTQETAPTAALEKLGSALGALERIRAEMTSLRAEYRSAAPARQQQIREVARQTSRQAHEFLVQAGDGFSAAYNVDPEHSLLVDVANRMVEVFFELNRFGEVRRVGQRLLDEEKASPKTTQLIGISYYADHLFEEAIKTFENLPEQPSSAKSGDGPSKIKDDARTYIEAWKKEQMTRAGEVAADDLPRVLLKTSGGNIVLELFENEAPNTVSNFIELIQKKYYDGLTFHRVIPAFMAQTGDPNTRDTHARKEGARDAGQGGPGYKIKCECYLPRARLHFAGSLSMAHEGKDSGGSQFFITHLPTAHLNGQHTVFGRTIEGLDVVRTLTHDDKIESATVLRKRDHEYTAEKL